MRLVRLTMLVVLSLGLSSCGSGTAPNPEAGDQPAPLDVTPFSAPPDTVLEDAAELEDIARQKEAAIAKWRIQTTDDQLPPGAPSYVIEADPDEEAVIYSSAPRTQLPNLFQTRPAREKKLSVSGSPTLAPEDDTTTTPKIIGGTVELEIKLD